MVKFREGFSEVLKLHHSVHLAQAGEYNGSGSKRPKQPGLPMQPTPGQQRQVSHEKVVTKGDQKVLFSVRVGSSFMGAFGEISNQAGPNSHLYGPAIHLDFFIIPPILFPRFSP